MPGTAGKWFEAVLVNAVVTPATAIFSNDLPPPSLEDLVASIVPRPGRPPPYHVREDEASDGQDTRNAGLRLSTKLQSVNAGP